MSRQATLLVLLGAALLIVALVITYRLRPVKLDPPIQEAAQGAGEAPPARLESTAAEIRSAPAGEAPVPLPAAQPPEDLRAEGARRGWQLPLGKGWWTDTLINPTGVDPEGAALEALQERVLGWCDRILALKQARAKRLAAYCQERIAVGLAVEDNAHEIPADGKQHEWITVHTLAEPNRTLRVDIAPGDDGELDRLDRQVADTWIEAVLDLRRRF